MNNVDRFKVGRRFTSPMSAHDWKIDRLDVDSGVIHVSDDYGYSIRINIDQFDTNFYFLDDLPVGFEPDKVIEAKCECGSDKYYASQGTTGPHSDYCPKNKKKEVKI